MKLIFKKFYLLTIILSIVSLCYGTNKGSLHGTVIDSCTKKPLLGVNVILKGTQLGSSTNEYGYYLLENISEGEYEICFSMIGYKERVEVIKITPNEAKVLDISLVINPIKMNEVQVVAKRYDDLKLSNRTIDIEKIKLMPTMCEQDIFHAIQTLPGIMTTDDYSKKLYVRGGDANQTTVLLDDLPVYNPLHAIGLFSPFHIDALKKAQLKSGGFSVKYGESASGIFRLETKDEVEKFSANMDLTILNLKTFLEGKTNNVNYNLAMRRSYEDLVLPIILGEVFPVAMSDVLGKFSFPLSKNSKISLLGYYSNDDLFIYDDNPAEEERKRTQKFSWGNRLASFQWFFSSDLYYSKFQIGLSTNIMKSPDDFIDANNRIQNVVILYDNKYLISEKSLISFGLSLRNNYFHYRWNVEDSYDSDYLQDEAFSTRETFLFFDFAPTEYDNKFSAFVSSLYIECSGRFNFPLSFVAGIRYTPSTSKLYHTIEPRIHLTYPLNKNLILKSSISRHSQYLTTAKDEGGFDFTFAGVLNAYDAWFPLLKPYKPIISDHFVSGIQWEIKNLLEVNIEGYLKTFTGLAASIDSYPHFVQGKGYAEGIEVFIEKRTTNIRSSISYTLSRTVKNINGEVYYPKYDRQHDLEGQISIKLPDDYSISLHGKWCTGTPYTRIVGKYYPRLGYGHHPCEYIEGHKNSERLPDYLRFDFQIVKNLLLFKKSSIFFFQIHNVTNRKNALYYKDLRVTGSFRERIFPTSYYKQLPVIPTIGIKIFF